MQWTCVIDAEETKGESGKRVALTTKVQDADYNITKQLLQISPGAELCFSVISFAFEIVNA